MGKVSTGLGLPFCKMAVEAHGGQISMESELERGTTFRFTIPLMNPAQAA
jgi:signal transduction histidine kinase